MGKMPKACRKRLFIDSRRTRATRPIRQTNPVRQTAQVAEVPVTTTKAARRFLPRETPRTPPPLPRFALRQQRPLSSQSSPQESTLAQKRARERSRHDSMLDAFALPARYDNETKLGNIAKQYALRSPWYVRSADGRTLRPGYPVPQSRRRP